MAVALVIGCGASSPEPPGAPGGRTLDTSRRAAAPVERESADQDDRGDPVEQAEPVEQAQPAVVLSGVVGDPVRVRVEVAATEAQRQRGLMHRRSLAADAGMLFVFPRMEHQSFWMENTHIALDMIFIDEALRVVGVVEDAEPLTQDAREVEGDSRYVLEVNAGFARRHGIEAGARVRFENLSSSVDPQEERP